MPGMAVSPTVEVARPYHVTADAEVSIWRAIGRYYFVCGCAALTRYQTDLSDAETGPGELKESQSSYRYLTHSFSTDSAVSYLKPLARSYSERSVCVSAMRISYLFGALQGLH